MKSDKLGTGGGRTGTSHARDSPYRNALGGGAPQCALLAKHHAEPATASTKSGGHCAGTTPNAHSDAVSEGLAAVLVCEDDGVPVLLDELEPVALLDPLPVALAELVPVALGEPDPEVLDEGVAVEDELPEPEALNSALPVALRVPASVALREGVSENDQLIAPVAGAPEGADKAARTCAMVLTRASERGGELHSPLGSSHKARFRMPALKAWLWIRYETLPTKKQFAPWSPSAKA